MSAALNRLGFDPPRLRYTLRTALAACLALMVAWLLGLEHPQWAAMTVFAASQPVRNMLVEKSAFRALGTLAGVVVGLILALISRGQPLVLVIGLAAWIGLCTWLGNILRGFVSYGTLLAGFSAAMVVLLDTAHPGHLFLLGLDRMLTALIGVATALVIGLMFTPRDPEGELPGRVRAVTVRILRLMARRLAGEAPGTGEQPVLLREMALIEEALDPHGAGSMRSRRSARTLRAIVAADVSCLVWLMGERLAHEDAGAGALTGDVADLLEARAPDNAVLEKTRLALEATTRQPALHDALQRLDSAMRDRFGLHGETARGGTDEPAIVLHRDWTGARQAAIRACALMFALGLLWVVTGWQAGPYLLLGTSVMISLFSTFENPARIMTSVLAGQVCGAAAALACRWLVWPHAGSEIDLVLMLMPFVLAGALPMAHSRTMAGATDYCMVLLLLSQPDLPLTGSFSQSLSMALAVVAGPLITLIAFRLFYPTDARGRLRALIAMMVRELQDMAGRPDAGRKQRTWRARLYHRLLRLVRWAERSGETSVAVEQGGLAVYALGATVLRLQDLKASADTPTAAVKAADVALRRLTAVARQPEAAARSLQRLAQRLERADHAAAPAFAAASEVLTRNQAFFRLAVR